MDFTISLAVAPPLSRRLASSILASSIARRMVFPQICEKRRYGFAARGKSLVRDVYEDGRGLCDGEALHHGVGPWHGEDVSVERLAVLVCELALGKEPPWACQVEMPVLPVRHLLEHSREQLPPREIPQHADREDVVVVFPLHVPQIIQRRADRCQMSWRCRHSLPSPPAAFGVLAEMEYCRWTNPPNYRMKFRQTTE